MENNPNSSIFNFGPDEETKSNLSVIARWANINAIVGFIGIGVTIISFIATMNSLGRYAGSFAGFGMANIALTVAISLALNITLFMAASNIKKAIDNSSQAHFEIGITKFATYFKIAGIITIIVLVVVVFFLMLGILSGRGRGF